jgi:hypothetical protein
MTGNEKSTDRGLSLAERKALRARRKPVQKPPLDPDVADTAPSDSVLTVYDEEHVITYLRLLDADCGRC